MQIELWWLFATAIAYLAVLFLVAYSADSNLLPRHWVSNPLVYSLSLGVYATSWTYYGSVGLADASGYAFLTIYLGVTGAFLLGPYILKPILTLCREYQLSSIADLLAFRYGGRGTGFIVTLFMLFGILPYISLQIRAVTESIQILSQQAPPSVLALVFCIVITVFAILFGARHLTPREKHHGLVLAIAFESAVKLIALLVAGVFVVTQVFDSPAALAQWANAQPDTISSLYQPGDSGLWTTLLLLAFCAAFLLPRQYHMTFVENEKTSHLRTAYWLFPLYLLILNLPIIPILFAGRFLELSIPPDFYVLGMTQASGHAWLAILVFIGGLSAASAMMIVTTLALSYMVLNHLLLPASLSSNQPSDFYQRLLWSKRLIITLIIAAGYGFYIVIELNEGLASLGLISFVAAAQLLPGVVGLLFWRRATQTGFLLGLLGGAVVWFLLLILPLLSPSTNLINVIPIQTDIWTISTFCSLSTNATLFIIGSLLRKPSLDELIASQATMEQASFALSKPYTARSAKYYQYALQQVLGSNVAEQEMQRALNETKLQIEETRPAELRILHERLERNISGLVGPTLARSILRSNRPVAENANADESPDTRLLEMHLESSREQLRGMTKQLDDLRRYLRDVLHELPLGACSVAADGTIYLWNNAMQSLTGIDASLARDAKLDDLPAPWNALLSQFAQSSETHRFRCPVHSSGDAISPLPVATINMHKADVGTPSSTDDKLAGQVILMEDRTDLDTLEAELAHSERLASVGRLAAGVAHEIGNPLTGIASIAQNLSHEIRSSGEMSLSSNELGYVGEQADDILGQVNRINSIVRSLLTFSHAEAVAGPSLEKVELCSSVEEALRLIQLSPEVRKLQFNVELNEPLEIMGESNQLVQVFVNLLNNACDASPVGASITIRGFKEHGQIGVRIEDQGQGIDQDIRKKMFEPFFTTKPVGSGTGLGLSLVYSIVQNHGGRIRIDENYKEGAAFVVSFPMDSNTVHAA